LIVQFYRIQIIEGNKWSKQARAQHVGTVIEPFMRGRIFSSSENEEKPLAIDLLRFHLFIDPVAIPLNEKEKIANKIFEFFDFSKEKKEKILLKFQKKSRSRKLVSWLTREKKEEIEKFWFKYIKNKKIAKNALFFVKDFKRSHPFEILLGQLLHTVQEEKDKNFQAIPTGGAELYFNEYLKGKLGFRQIFRSSRNVLNTKKVIQKPEDGKDIYLTIDRYIQAIVEEELEKGVKKLNAKGGWAIMMDPKSGEILALGQYPFFDLENYSKYFNDRELQEHSRVKAVSDAFEPGSIMKPITLAICLKANRYLEKMGEEALFFPMEKIDTSDGNFSGRHKPIRDLRFHKFLNMYLAIQKSSNIYVGKIVERLKERLGDLYYKNALLDLGFGKRTGIEIPAETVGFVPTPGKFYKSGKMQWSKSTPYSLAMGYNILVNGIQMVKAYAILANYGMDVEPTILKKIVRNKKNGTSEIIFDNSKKLKKNVRILEKADVAQIINALKFTTKVGGTAKLGDIKGFTEAGKTGTSEKIVDGKYSNKLHISSFIGFAPARNAKFVLLVVIDEPEKRYVPGVGGLWYGGVAAAPIFREIGRRTLEYLGVEPDDPFGYPDLDPRSDSKKADWFYEVKLMKKLYDSWNN
jgi:cell division protein FtsI (penicillin-binding protein 3)